MPREGRPLTNLCGTEHGCKEFFRPAALGDTAVLRSGFGPQWTWDYRAVPRFVDIGVLIRHNRGLVPEAASDLVERIPDLARSRVEKKKTDKNRQDCRAAGESVCTESRRVQKRPLRLMSRSQ